MFMMGEGIEPSSEGFLSTLTLSVLMLCPCEDCLCLFKALHEYLQKSTAFCNFMSAVPKNWTVLPGHFPGSGEHCNQTLLVQSWISCPQERHSLVCYNATVLINALQALTYWDHHHWVRGFQAHSLGLRMLNWVIMRSNCVPFYGEVDTCLLVNRHRDDPHHLAQVTKQPLGW